MKGQLKSKGSSVTIGACFFFGLAESGRVLAFLGHPLNFAKDGT